jgi:hypothetical protein
LIVVAQICATQNAGSVCRSKGAIRALRTWKPKGLANSRNLQWEIGNACLNVRFSLVERPVSDLLCQEFYKPVGLVARVKVFAQESRIDTRTIPASRLVLAKNI